MGENTLFCGSVLSNFIGYNNPKRIIDFLGMGFDDYLATRFLLYSQFHLQGATLASTAIEKYLKAAFCIVKPTSKVPRKHFDKFENILEEFDGTDSNGIKVTIPKYDGQILPFRMEEDNIAK